MPPRRSPNEAHPAPQPFHTRSSVAANPQSQCVRHPGDGRWCIASLVVVNLILLSACAHHALGCAFGRYYDDCVPGTTAYEAHNARAIAADRDEDAVCKNEGLPSRSPAYAECRVSLANELDPDTRAALIALAKARGDQFQFDPPMDSAP
jgi:hypothetical protein